ncbi:MAG: NUDIX hydrolase [Terrimicrobiaceae bacterium]
MDPIALDSPPSSSGWSTLSAEILCASPWLTVTREKIATPSRPGGVDWLVAKRPTAAVVAPRDAEGNYVLIRQERVAVRRETWEFPAGQIEGPVNEESIRATALRELGEEAAVVCPQPLLSLGFFFSSAGFTDECCHLFLAAGVEAAPHLRDHDAQEAIHEVKKFTPAELREAIANGQIIDGNTLACFARLGARGIFE